MFPLRALRFALLLTLLGTAGCASENKGKIEGKKWRSCTATVKGQSLSDGALHLEFKTDGGLVYRARNQVFRGTYTLGPGKSVILNLDRELAGRKSHTESVEIRGDRLFMTDSDGTSLMFYEDQ